MHKMIITIVALALLLVGCNQSKETTVEDKSTAAPEKVEIVEETTEETTEPTFELTEDEIAQQNLNSTYYKLATSIIKKHGILLEDGQLSGEGGGLAFIDLINFNDDNTLELYMLYETSSDEYDDDYSMPSYTEEIWGIEDGEEVLLHTKRFFNGGLVDDATRSIVTIDGVSYLIETGGYSSGNTDDPNWIEYGNGVIVTGYKDQEFKEIGTVSMSELTHIETGEIKMEYSKKINEMEYQDITQQEYEQFLSDYHFDDRKMIVDSEAGSKSLVLDVTNNSKIIDEFLTNLRDNINTFAEVYGSGNVADDVRSEMEDFLNYFHGLPSFTEDNYNDLDIMSVISSGIASHRFSESELTISPNKEPIYAEISYYPYEAEQVNQLTQKLFGKTVQPQERYTSIEVIEEGTEYEDEIEYDVALFKDGHFYIAGPDSFIDDEGEEEPFPTYLEQTFELGNELYYVEFAKYYEGTEERTLQNQYINGHALLKRTDEELPWKLVKYSEDSSVMTDKELEKFLIGKE